MQKPNEEQASGGQFAVPHEREVQVEAHAKSPWWKLSDKPTFLRGWTGAIVIVFLLFLLIGPSVLQPGSDPNKTKLDTEELSKFAAEIQLRFQTKADVVAGLPDEYESFEHLMLTLYRHDVLSTDMLKRLAGLSGSRLTDTEYSELKASSATSFPDNRACIFTGPKRLSEMKRLQLGATDGATCVLFTYDDATLNEKLDIGLPFMLAGSAHAQMTKREAFDLEFKEQLELPPYGKGAFRYVAPN